MKINVEILKKIKLFRNDIKTMRSISELINYISMPFIENIASLLLIIWIISPLLMMLSNNISYFTYESGYYNYIDVNWFTLLQQLGFLGILLGLLFFWKSVIHAKNNKISYKQYISLNIFNIFIFILLIWSTVSCIASDNISLSFYGDTYRKDGLVAYYAYFGVFCCGYVLRDKLNVYRIIKYFVHSSALISLLVFINNKTLNSIFGFGTNRAIFNNINHFAYYLCLALMCANLLFLMESRDNHFTLLLRIFEFSIITAALVKNMSFGPYVAVVFGLLSCLILIKWLDKETLKRIIIGLTVFFSISLVMNIFYKFISNDILKFFADAGNILHGTKEAAEAGSGRWKLWLRGIQFITEKPMFGYGPDNLGARYAEFGIKNDRPHNVFIQVAASLGIPGLLFYLTALASHFVSFIKKRRYVSTNMIGIFCVVISYLVSSFFGNSMFYTTPFFCIILGVSVGTLKSVDSEKLVDTNELN